MSNWHKLFVTTALATCMGVLPAMAERLGLGRAAHPEEIAAWDVAVMPDGRGLPEGHGNVLDGEDLWVDYCAACHGDFAEGAGAWPPIVGGRGTLTASRPLKTVESYWPYLSTVFDYVNRSMPFGAAQTLETDEVYAIVAYILYSAGLVEDDFELSHENFTEIRLPNEGGFYIDDRNEAEAHFVHEPCMSDCRESAEVALRAVDLNVTPDFHVIRNLYTDPLAVSLEIEAPEEEAALQEEAPAQVQTVALDPALVAAGEGVWRQCRSCHQVGEGARNGTGPALNGIVGAMAGQVDGFRYSPVMAESGLVWDAATLDAFLENPGDLLPRNRMSFRGLRSAEEREAVIAYLKSHAN